MSRVRAWGEQTSVIAGVHAATAALIALHVLETESRGQIVDLSVQEAVAHSIENAAQYVDLGRRGPPSCGPGPREAGTGLFRCADGWIYLVGGLGGSPLAWNAIAEWLADGGVTYSRRLGADRWQQPDWRRTAEACAPVPRALRGVRRLADQGRIVRHPVKARHQHRPRGHARRICCRSATARARLLSAVDVDGSARRRCPGRPPLRALPTCGPRATAPTAEEPAVSTDCRSTASGSPTSPGSAPARS